jgi:hypothetical protein
LTASSNTHPGKSNFRDNRHHPAAYREYTGNAQPGSRYASGGKSLNRKEIGTTKYRPSAINRLQAIESHNSPAKRLW